MTPRISVIVPTFNYGRYVAEAVDSALAQTLTPLEVIVVDDGSTDDTRVRLAAYGDRIRYVYQENRGLSAARNAGILQAHGEWIALLDSDDVWHRQKLEIQFEAVTAMPDARFFGSPGARSLPESLPVAAPTRRLAVRDFLVWMPIGPSSVVLHRSCFDSAGLFDETLRSVEDRDMWLRLATRFPAVCIEVGCWWYRQHEAQMNRSAERMHRNYVQVLKGFFKAFPEYRSHYRLAWAFLFMDSGYSYLAAGDRIRAIAFLLRSAWLHPRPIEPGRLGRARRRKLLARALMGDSAFAWLSNRANVSQDHGASDRV